MKVFHRDRFLSGSEAGSLRLADGDGSCRGSGGGCYPGAPCDPPAAWCRREADLGGTAHDSGLGWEGGIILSRVPGVSRDGGGTRDAGAGSWCHVGARGVQFPGCWRNPGLCVFLCLRCPARPCNPRYWIMSPLL